MTHTHHEVVFLDDNKMDVVRLSYNPVRDAENTLFHGERLFATALPESEIAKMSASHRGLTSTDTFSKVSDELTTSFTKSSSRITPCLNG